MKNTETVKGIWNKLPNKRKMQVIAAAVTFVAVYIYVAASKTATPTEAQAPITAVINAQNIMLILQIATLGLLILIYMQLRKAPIDTEAAKAKRKADLLKQLRDLEHDNTNTEITPETPPPPPPPPPTKRRVKERKP